MQRYESDTEYHDRFEYHGNTTIEVVRKKNGITIKRNWILFNSVEEAQNFFFDSRYDSGGYYAQ